MCRFVCVVSGSTEHKRLGDVVLWATGESFGWGCEEGKGLVGGDGGGDPAPCLTFPWPQKPQDQIAASRWRPKSNRLVWRPHQGVGVSRLGAAHIRGFWLKMGFGGGVEEGWRGS